MKRLVWTIAVFLTGFGIYLTDAQAKIPGEENLIQKIKEVLTPVVSAPKSLPQDFHPVCATPAFVWITGHKNELSPEAQKELSLIMPPRPIYTTTEKTYDTPGGHFRIHYVTSTEDSVYQSHVDVSPADSVPDYVNFVGAVMDYMWKKEVDTLGYLTPPDDGWYYLIPADNGGNSRYDVYLKYMDWGYLGYTQPEYSIDPPSFTSYIVLRNDYSLYSGYRPDYNDYLRVTSAHEFFHAIQFGYDGYEYEYVPSDPSNPFRPYWMELSATWMEDVVYDNVNDYLSYLPYFYDYPWLSLKAFSYDSGDPSRYYHAYAACVWAFYLSEKFGLNTVRDIWTMCADVQGDNVLSATDDALLLKGSSLDQAFREFSVWNYFTGTRADTVNFYSEGNGYPLVNIYPTQVYYSYPVSVSSVPYPPEVLGTNYVMFIPEVNPGGLSLNFNGSDSAKWKASLIGNSTFLPISFTEFNLDSLQSGNVKIHNWSYYDNIIMIPAVITQTSGSFNYSYQALYDSTLTKVEEQQVQVPNTFSLSQNYPNPFNPSTTIPFTVNSSQFMVHRPIHTTLKIYNILGELVRTLLDEEKMPGDYQVVWDGRDDKGEKVSSGIYFYRLEAGGYAEMKKMVLIK